MSDIENSYGPIQDEYRAQMNALAKAIDELLNGDKPREVGFVLLVFPFEKAVTPDSHMNYISNAERSDMIAAMKELLANWEGRKMKEPKETQ